jgi:hypothetical protein
MGVQGIGEHEFRYTRGGVVRRRRVKRRGQGILCQNAYDGVVSAIPRSCWILLRDVATTRGVPVTSEYVSHDKYLLQPSDDSN